MSDDASARAAIASGGAPMSPGRWYPPYNHGGLSTGVLSNSGRILAIPFLISRACLLTGIGVDVTVASEAGGLLRYGLASDAGGLPGAVLLDAGTSDATATGFNPVTIAQAVQPDWYWVLVGAQSCPTTRPTCRVYQQGAFNRVGNTTGGSAAANSAYTMDGVAAALPSNYVAGGVTVASVVPTVWLKS